MNPLFRLKCKRCVNNIQTQPPPQDTDCTSHLSQWYHCSNNKGLPDSTLSQAWHTSRCISFVFHHRSQVVLTNDAPAAKTISDEPKKDTIGNQQCKKYKQDSSDEEDYVEQDDSKDSDFE